MLAAESKLATQALRKIRRGATLRVGFLSIGIAILCTGIPTVIMCWTLPSGSEISELRARRDELSANIAALERRGGRVDWRRCGNTTRLCVRVDRQAPVFGEKADYYVVAGY